MGAAAELADEALAWGAYGTKGADGQNNEAHAGRQRAVLVARAAGGSGNVCGKAGGVSVIISDVSGSSSIKGLNIN